MSSSRYLNTIPLQWLVCLGNFDCCTLACELDCSESSIRYRATPFLFLPGFFCLHIALSFSYIAIIWKVCHRGINSPVDYEPMN